MFRSEGMHAPSRFPTTERLLDAMARLCGPALLISIGYMTPATGNRSIRGASFKYDLLWVSPLQFDGHLLQSFPLGSECHR